MTYIRLYSGEIKVCKHISLKGSIEQDHSGCEYFESLVITCKKCKNTFDYDIMIN